MRPAPSSRAALAAAAIALLVGGFWLSHEPPASEPEVAGPDTGGEQGSPGWAGGPPPQNVSPAALAPATDAPAASERAALDLRAGTWRVEVVGADGALLDDARLAVEGRASGDAPWTPVRTGPLPGGVFEVPLADFEPREAHLFASAPGLAPTGAVVVPAGDRTTRLVLRGGATLYGRVVDPWGRPAADARVVARSPATGAVVETRAGANGAFAVGVAADREWRVRASRAPFGESPEVEARGEAGEFVSLGPLQLDGAAEFAGRILLPDGRAADRLRVVARMAPPGSRIQTLGGERETDVSGRYAFGQLPPDEWELEARGLYKVVELEPTGVAPGEYRARALRVEFAPPDIGDTKLRELRWKLRGDRNDVWEVSSTEAFPGAGPVVLYVSPGPSEIALRVETADGRRFAGEATLPRAPEDWSVTVEAVEIDPGSAARLSVRVEGEPAAKGSRATLHLRHPDAADRQFSFTHRGFDPASRSLPPGAWTLELKPGVGNLEPSFGALVIEDEALVLEPGGEHELVARVVAGGFLDLFVERPAGLPKYAVDTELTPLAGGPVLTDVFARRSGRRLTAAIPQLGERVFSAFALAPGVWRLRARATDRGAWVERDFLVRAGEVTPLAIAVPPPPPEDE